MSNNLTLLILFTVFINLAVCLMGQKQVAQRGLWCVAKNNADDQSLQAAIDWACGPGGANCNPIQNGGPCYNPNDIQTAASWAFNDYYLKNGLSDDACFFSNTAALTSLNPSHDGCKFPSSLSAKGGGNFSASSTTTSIDMEPELSGCSQIAGTWFWHMVISSLFVILAMTFGV